VTDNQKAKLRVDPIRKPHWKKLPAAKRRRYEQIMRSHAKTLEYLKNN
jgi:hypothetical protein